MKPLYNKLTDLPKIPYKIIEYIAKSNNEDLWKVLYYPDYDCLSKPNLTFKQKMDLIWKNESDEFRYRIFLKPLVSSELTDAMTQLRLNQINIKPTDQYSSIILYEFLIITGEKIALMDFDGVPVPRIDFIEKTLLDLLNGKDIGVGTSYFQFNQELSRESQARLSVNNGKTAFGSSLIMGIMVSNLGENSCES